MQNTDISSQTKNYQTQSIAKWQTIQLIGNYMN